MAAVVVTGVFGVLLVWFALQALRRGTLALPGNGSLQRGQSTFLLAVMALFGVGVWALSMAAAEAHALFDTDPGPMHTVEGPDFVIEVPERWQASDVGLPDEDAMSFVHPHGDLTVLFPPGGAASQLEPEALRDPSIRYSRWEVERRDRTLEVRMRYPTPRGEVIGRLVAWDEDGKTSSAQALCTFDSEELAPVCERVVGSLSHR